jgi:hypothetical protein
MNVHRENQQKHTQDERWKELIDGLKDVWLDGKKII